MIPRVPDARLVLFGAVVSAFLAGACAPSQPASETAKPVFLYSLYYNAEGENRYPPDGNYSEVLQLLSEDFEVRVHREPLTDETLADVKVVLISNPSDQAVPGYPAPPHISDEEAATLTRFIENGGGVIIQLNQEDHNLQVEPVNRFLARFGMQAHDHYTDVKLLTIPEDEPILGGLRWAYIIGNSLTIDPSHPARPRAIVTNDLEQKLVGGTRDAPGILLAGAEPGNGRLVVITDAGWIINNALNGEEVANVVIKEQDNREIMRRLSRWTASLPTH